MSQKDLVAFLAFIALIIALSVLLLFTPKAHAHTPDTKAAREKVWDCIPNAKKHEKVDGTVKTLTCLIMSEIGYESFKITSGCRWPKSWHHPGRDGICLAQDGHPGEYTGKKLEEHAAKYVSDIWAIIDKMDDIPFLAEKLRFGIYPPHFCGDKEISGGLIFHFDTGDKLNGTGRWSRICGKYIGIIEGLQKFREYLVAKGI